MQRRPTRVRPLHRQHKRRQRPLLPRRHPGARSRHNHTPRPLHHKLRAVLRRARHPKQPHRPRMPQINPPPHQPHPQPRHPRPAASDQRLQPLAVAIPGSAKNPQVHHPRPPRRQHLSDLAPLGIHHRHPVARRHLDQQSPAPRHLIPLHTRAPDQVARGHNPAGNGRAKDHSSGQIPGEVGAPSS